MEYIKALAENLNQNPLMNMVFLLLAIFGIILSVYLFLKSKKEIKPCINKKSFELISDSISNIEDMDILYKGEKIPNLTLSKIALWNEGKATLNKTDIAEKDPLYITLGDDTRILKANVLHTSKSANNFSVSLSEDACRINILFDYLHTNEGAIIEVFHMGGGKSKITFCGSIKSSPILIDRSDMKDALTNRVLENIIPEWFVRLYEYNKWLARPFMLLLVPVTLPFLIIDIVLNPIRTIPKEFDL